MHATRRNNFTYGYRAADWAGIACDLSITCIWMTCNFGLFNSSSWCGAYDSAVSGVIRSLIDVRREARRSVADAKPYNRGINLSLWLAHGFRQGWLHPTWWLHWMSDNTRPQLMARPPTGGVQLALAPSTILRNRPSNKTVSTETSCYINGSDSPHRHDVTSLLRATGCVRRALRPDASIVQGVSSTCAHSRWGSELLSYTWLTRVWAANDFAIGSVILAGFTVVTSIQTDRPRHPTCKNSMHLALCRWRGLKW